MAALPISAQDKRAGRRRKKKHWTELLRPDKHMGVPQLMMILEPNVVWDHTRAFVAELGKEVESQYGQGEWMATLLCGCRASCVPGAESIDLMERSKCSSDSPEHNADG